MIGSNVQVAQIELYSHFLAVRLLCPAPCRLHEVVGLMRGPPPLATALTKELVTKSGARRRVEKEIDANVCVVQQLSSIIITVKNRNLLLTSQLIKVM